MSFGRTVAVISVVVAALALAVAGTARPLQAQGGTGQDPWPGKKKVLAIGDARSSFQHDSVSHALATIDRLGRESGDWITIIKTETQLVTKGPVKFGATVALNAKNLDYFDAIFFFGAGPGDLTSEQKRDLLAFVRDDGKGYVAAHSGANAFLDWPDYAQMIGGTFDHPWSKPERLVMDVPVVVEAPDFPAMQGLPSSFTVRDEPVVHKAPYSRDAVRVLASMDVAKADKGNARQPADTDVALAWAKTYGQGRVFYSSLGHADDAWDDPKMQSMFRNAIRWALKLTDGDARPRGAQP
jgi:type 1 glutamine amidotransferase